MTDDPPKLQDYDLELLDSRLQDYLLEHYLQHPTRGPFATSKELYREFEDELDDNLTPQLFGVFCESRPYLEKWTTSYGGSCRYRILTQELRHSGDG
jgi:hypothetical protein